MNHLLPSIPPTRKKTCCVVLVKLEWLPPVLSVSNRRNATTTIVSQRWLIVDAWGALNPVSCPVGCIFSVGHAVGTDRLSQWTGTPKASQGRSLTIHVVCAVVCTRVEPERFRRFGHFHLEASRFVQPCVAFAVNLFVSENFADERGAGMRFSICSWRSSIERKRFVRPDDGTIPYVDVQEHLSFT